MNEISKSFLFDMYIMMLKIRLCEESLVQPIYDGQIKCPCHLYSGEEAIAVGICAALEPKDVVYGNHRSHGHYLAKGGSLNAMVAEIYGKKTGCSKGRGGSMHLIDTSVGMLGSAPIVAGTISLAVGSALSSSIRKEDFVSVSFFGDGASNEGVLFECMSFSKLKNLPVLFVCENNFYSTHMPIDDCRPNMPIHKMADALGINNKLVDGNDVLAVHQAAVESIELCRKGGGPAFLECHTYRLRGHVGPDDNIQGTHTDIRPTEQMEQWRLKDPLIQLEKYLVENNIADKSDLLKINNELEIEITEAHSFANNSPYPDEKELTDYVFK